MSDGIWEAEYERADALKEEIETYCKENNLECPQFEQYARSWELKEFFENLKKNNK